MTNTTGRIADGAFTLDLTSPTRTLLNTSDGDDTVTVLADPAVTQVRLTFTSSEVGNSFVRDSNTLANQDGSLAVRVQTETAAGLLAGPVSRVDDEGTTFESNGAFTFDVRDLVSGVSRGDLFEVVQLGTVRDDLVDERTATVAYYINAGMGNDTVMGGLANDFLVGGAGNDQLSGRSGNDSFIGGGGDDMIFGSGGDDTAIVTLATDGADQIDLGIGRDTVNIVAPVTAAQVRVTFTSAEVGNGSATDSNTLANQDGGLAVRLQAEDGAGGLTGPVGRYDDEGVQFVSTVPGVTFDVRDLVSGVSRGDQFSVVQLGTLGGDRFDESGETRAYYINAGMGDDRVFGGDANDFLVGGGGNDVLYGNLGNDTFIGGGGDDTMGGGAGADTFIFAAGPGNDTILNFKSGSDKLDLRALAITSANITATSAGGDTQLAVDVNADAVIDFLITLRNANAPVDADYLFT